MMAPARGEKGSDWAQQTLVAAAGFDVATPHAVPSAEYYLHPSAIGDCRVSPHNDLRPRHNHLSSGPSAWFEP